MLSFVTSLRHIFPFCSYLFCSQFIILCVGGTGEVIHSQSSRLRHLPLPSAHPAPFPGLCHMALHREPFQRSSTRTRTSTHAHGQFLPNVQQHRFFFPHPTVSPVPKVLYSPFLKHLAHGITDPNQPPVSWPLGHHIFCLEMPRGVPLSQRPPALL